MTTERKGQGSHRKILAGATGLRVEGLNDEKRLGAAEGLGSTEHQGNPKKHKSICFHSKPQLKLIKTFQPNKNKTSTIGLAVCPDTLCPSLAEIQKNKNATKKVLACESWGGAGSQPDS